MGQATGGGPFQPEILGAALLFVCAAPRIYLLCTSLGYIYIYTSTLQQVLPGDNRRPETTC